MRWPIQRVLTDQHQPTRWAVVHAPVESPHRMQLLADLRRDGTRFVGMSSETTFPEASAHAPIDYLSLCEAWCHCSREPESFLPPTMPRIRLSLSDFVDPTCVVEMSRSTPSGASVDFVHVTADQPWKSHAKGWPLAQRCLPVLSRLGLRGVVIGAPASDVQPVPGIVWRPFMPRATFLSTLSRAGFLLVTSDQDASPRVLAESLSLDVPVLLHRRILGGWHYLVPETGFAFDSEVDVEDGAVSCLTGGPWQCRAWFESHHGPERSGTKLAELLSPLDPALDPRRPLILEPADESRAGR